MHILSEEFSRQASMENELEIKSSLMAPPKKDVVSLSNAQLGFMNMFAIPLFQGVADIMPAMKYTVEELGINKDLFENMVREEKAKQDPEAKQLQREGTSSPKSVSANASAEQSTQESSPQSEAVRQVSGDASECTGKTPSALIDVQLRDRQQISPPPAEAMGKPGNSPSSATDLQDLNGTASSFNAVRELADSDPFGCRDGDSKISPSRRQRCSETTDGSTSCAVAGDWASQATSAATGKMPISPSTQGTSIVSRESMERPSSMPGLSVSPPSTTSSPATVKKEGVREDGSITSTGSLGHADGKSLKKKPSRFRMKDFPFFRRRKGSNPAYPADTTG